MRSRSKLPVTAATVVALVGGVAFAAETETDDTALKEVVVTATLKAEPLQNVPLTVTAVDPDVLQKTGLTDTRSLQLLVPSLTFTQGPSVNTASLAIRGVGTESTSVLTEESVSLVVDGIVQAVQGQDLGQLVDIDRIEVLEGPQGMLFGKNASAGVVNIATRDPVINEFTLSSYLAHASFNDNTANFVANVPIDDNQALRVSGYSHHRDGLITNVVRNDTEDDDNSYGARVKYLWQGIPGLRLVLSADYSADDQTAGEGTILSAGPGTRVAVAAASLGIIPGPNNLVSMEGGSQRATPENKGISLQSTYALGAYTLTSITGYRNYNINYIFDPDGSPATITEGLDVQTENQTSEELRIASPSGGFIDYVAGLFYFRKAVENGQTSYGTFNTLSPPRPAGLLASSGDIITSLVNSSYAGFGRATLHFTDKFSGILGARYTIDDYTINNRTVVVPKYAGLPPTFVQVPSSQTGSDSNDNVSWQAGLQYQFDKNLMAYVTASKGYKGPVPENNTPTSITLSKPEIPTSYELGLKSSWFNRSLVLNADVFHAVYNNFQAAAFDFQAVPPVARVTNAGSLVTQGVELSATGRAAKGLTLSANVDYLDAYYRSFVNDSCWLGETLGEGCVPTGIGTNVVNNSSGNRLEDAPRWTAAFFADYERSLTRNLDLYLSGNYFHKSGVFWTSSNSPFTWSPAYSLIGLSAGVGSADGKWTTRVFVKNLLNTRFAARIQDVASGQRGDEQQYFDPEAFRYVGISLDLHF
jgi:iron complex outermembrane receptor protein